MIAARTIAMAALLVLTAGCSDAHLRQTSSTMVPVKGYWLDVSWIEMQPGLWDVTVQPATLPGDPTAAWPTAQPLAEMAAWDAVAHRCPDDAPATSLAAHDGVTSAYAFRIACLPASQGARP